MRRHGNNLLKIFFIFIPPKFASQNIAPMYTPLGVIHRGNIFILWIVDRHFHSHHSLHFGKLHEVVVGLIRLTLIAY